MATEASRPIVVGIDGSPQSYRALDWALTEARLRETSLRLVHAADPFDYTAAGIAAQQAAAEETTTKAAAHVRATAPDIELAAETVHGNPAGSLVDESSRAMMVVVGNRGLGGFRGLLVGSVAVQVTAHAHCPVIVVRPPVERAPKDGQQPEGTGSVVVGVDGSTLSEPAIEFAFAEAALRGVGVTAVHVWSYPLVPNPSDMAFAVAQRTDFEDVEIELLTRSLAPFAERYPDVPVRRMLVPGAHPAAALMEQSAAAELLVVGSRGHGGFAGLLLGSVSHAALHHAHCPVAVVAHLEAQKRSAA